MAAELERIARRRDERGMTTAEYAVGTVATVSFVGVLLAIIGSPEFRNTIWDLIQVVIKIVIQYIGSGGA